MKLAFVAGKYRADTIHGIVENIRKAEAVAIELWKYGYAVITPHLNTRLLDGVCPDKVWLDGGLEILRRCDLIVLLEGWESSEGAIDECIQAELIGIPVFEWANDQKRLKEFSKD